MYEPVHYYETALLTKEPDLGRGNSSYCLDRWLETFCKIVSADRAHSLSKSAAKALCHTLVDARARFSRMSDRINELELENMKLKSDLDKMRD